MNNRVGSLVVTLALSLGCGGSGSTTTPTSPSGGMSADAAAYLDRLILIMQSNSLRRLEIDWTTFRNTVIADASAARTIPDLLPAIRTAIRLLGDGHSFYTTAGGAATIFIPTHTCLLAGPRDPPVLPINIGYVRVGSFNGSSAAGTAFAEMIQATIAAADRDDLIGWVVDLRGNGGGDMWPMIAGLGPVLGSGPLGYFIELGGRETAWDYRDGRSYSGGSAVVIVSRPYQLRKPQPKVAVLTDNSIASSGEAVFVAFRGRPNTRSFGQTTCGLSTYNSPFTLSDGALLMLTVGVDADRTKTRYGDSIAPDEIIDDFSQVVTRAIAWLQSP